MRKILTTALAGMALFATAAVANSVDATNGQINITATVSEKCNWNTSSATINIQYDPLNGTGYDAKTATLTFDCVKNTDGTISWTAQNGALSDGTNNIPYTLTVSLNGNTINSGDTFTDTNGVDGLTGGAEETLNFVIDPDDNVNAPVGTYTETITVTISLQ